MRPSTGLALVGAGAAVAVGIAVLTDSPMVDFDKHVAWHYWPITSTTTTDFAWFLQHIGKPWIACLVIGTLAALESLRTRRIGPAAGAIVALGCVGFSTLFLKQVFPRPSVVLQLPGSFPSGHTGVAVVVAGLLVLLLAPARPWRDGLALAIGMTWGAVMAWGRLVIEAHWLSDVIAGWGIGVVALVLAIRTADSPLGRRGLPRLIPGGK